MRADEIRVHFDYAQSDWQYAESPLFLSQKGSRSPTRNPPDTLHAKKLHPNWSQLEEISSVDSHPREAHSKKLSQSGVTVIIPPARDRWRYHVYRDNRSVDEVLEEFDDSEGLQFRARLSDGNDVKVSWY